tara:strand:- start:2444 stop:2734 length:291 start_codon:yes stop_codon:yes gene_type:complete
MNGSLMSKPTQKQNTEPATTSFENAFSELEDVVRKLENGGLSLDESTSLFELGMKLASKCNEILTSSELKITRLQKNFAEQMNLVPDDKDVDEEDS